MRAARRGSCNDGIEFVDGVVGDHRGGMKGRAVTDCRAAGERPVRPQGLEMDVQPERRVEALREGDASDAGIGDGLVTSASLVGGRDGADEDAADAGAGGGVVGAEVADAVG